MASFPVTITVQNTPPIEAFGSNISYDELINSLGSYYYLLEKIFIETYTVSQANEPMSFSKFNVDGSKRFDVVSPNIDPYGRQTAVLTDVSEFNLVMDGQLDFSYIIFSMSWVRFTFFTKRGYVSEGLDKYSISNFKKVKQGV